MRGEDADTEEPDDTADDGADATKREGQASARPRPKPKREEEQLARGTLLGRYVVLDVLGMGGMGVVYSAYDPELDRKVAVKLLQASPAGGSHNDQAWLLREAQAMARLAHPNVIAVHDVGTLPGDRVFVAMELVEGKTLRAWLEEAKRTWRDVLPVMRAAGTGLAAAHAAGLVHRDFKPDNVLVGNDGRVRVLDFGLARLRREDETDDAPAARDSSPTIEARSPLEANLTEAGTVVGTPAYMAPEILDGHGADPRTDQFAFGVALWEALYGKRPFARGQAKTELPKPPADSAVPARLGAIVTRALAAQRDARYPSMDELLAALAFDPAATRRRVAIAIGAIATVGAVAAGAVVLAGHRAPRCAGIERRLAGVWDDDAKRAVRAHYEASKRPFQAQAFTALSTALDAYAADWTTAAVDNCEATRVRGEQSEEMQALREECNGERLDELHALVKLLGNADGAVVDQGDKVAFGLEPIKQCANLAALRGTQPAPTEPKAKIDELRSKLADSKAQLVAGQYIAAASSAAAGRKIADEVGYEPFVSQASLARGVALIGVTNYADGRTALADATWAAIRAKRPDLAVRGALGVVASQSGPTGNAGDAKTWLALAKAFATQLGTDHEVEMQLATSDGNVAAASGDKQASLEAHLRSLSEAMQVFGPDNPALWSREADAAAALTDLGEYAKAMPHFDRALALREKSVGRDHPEIALLLTNMGISAAHLGQLDRARDAYKRALAIREKAYGATSPALLTTLNNYGDFMKEHGDVPAAIAALERARAIAEKVPGPMHPLYHVVSTTYAETLVAAGRLDEARTIYDQVLELEAKAKSPILSGTQSSRAELALREQDWARAAGLEQQAIAGFETGSGKEAPDLVKPLTGLARAQIGLGKPADAKPLLDRALAIGTKAGLGPEDLAATRDALAKL